jgi:hypothetical protein
LYLFPATISSPKNNPAPLPQALHEVEILQALHEAFCGDDAEVYGVHFETRYSGSELQRRTRVVRAGEPQQESDWSPIRRA